MTYTLIPVTRTYLNGATPRTGTVRLQLVGPLYNEGEIADRQPQIATLDSAGSISLTVRATNDPATLPVGGGAYEVTETLSGLATAVYYIEVPYDGGPVDLATAPHLAPGDINAPSVLFQPVNERGLPGGYPVLDGSGRVPHDQLPADLGGGGGSGVVINGDATNIQSLGTRAAGTTGKAADAGHVHQMPTLNQVGAPTANLDLNGKRVVNSAPGVAPTDLATVAQLGQSLLGWLNVKDTAYGAKGDGTTDDTVAIQAALDAAPAGGVVYLPEGIYRTSAPLVLPPAITLRGSHANMMTALNLADPPCYIQPLPSFTGAMLILLKDQASGGYAKLPAEHRIENLMLDGSTLDGTKPIDGIFAAGNIQNVRMDKVTIRRMSNNGIVTGSIADVFPYSWRMTNVMIDNCRGNGVLFTRMTDLTMIDCQAIGNWAQGMVLSNIANSQLIGCRWEWNGSHGLHITGSWGNGTGSGGMQLDASSTDRNGGHGVLIDATGNAPISITNLATRRDGRNGGSGGGGFAGLAVVGATMPVVANTVTCYPGVDDDNTGTSSPQYGALLSGSTSVQLDGLYLHAVQEGIHDDGTNTAVTLGSNVTAASGPTTAPARNVRPAGNGWLNVKQFNAKGDGITDDTAALQAAITAGAAAHTTVYLPPGTYMVSAPIVVPAGEGLTVAGAGWGSSIKLLAASNCFIFKMTAADTRVTFRDLEIDGNCLEQGTTGTSGGIDGSGSVASLYFNLHFIACRDDALYLAGMTGGAFGHNNKVIGCLFDQSMTSTGPGRGIHMDSNDENQVIGCDFEYLGGSGGTGATAASMIFDQCGTQFISDSNFVNGGNNVIGVRVQDAKSTKITGCNFDGLAGTAIFLAAQRCVVTSNTIFSVGHAGTAGQASGIHLEYATADNIIAHNVITSDPTNGVSRGAIREASDGASGRNNISNNTIVTSGTWAYAALDLSGSGSLVLGNIGGGAIGNQTIYLSVKNPAYGAKGDGTTDDTAAIQAALTACPAGGIVYLPPGVYRTSAPLTIPPYVTLKGTHGGGEAQSTSSPRPSAIKPLASFTGGAIVQMLDQQLGGYTTLASEIAVYNLTIDGSALTAGSGIAGIRMTGQIQHITLRDVQVRQVPGNGFDTAYNLSAPPGPQAPFCLHWDRLSALWCGGTGFALNNSTDSYFADCYALGCSSWGWYVAGVNGGTWVGCRAEWCGLDGFNLATNGAVETFIGCSTDRNAQNGFSIPSGASTGTVVLSGCRMTRDGRSSTTSGYAGLNVNGATRKVIVDGVVITTGRDDDGSTGNLSPQYGVSATNAAYVVVASGDINGVTSAWRDGGGNTTFLRGSAVTGSNLAQGLMVKEGTNTRMGVATLVAGTVTVNNTIVGANSRIFLTRATAGGTLGQLSYTVNPGVGFTINSAGAETSTVNWMIVEAA
ncbi:glycosyl hydrolase family 28-related protein [Streptomyces mirabilis]|uniref:glycosyl hydrolase family 28-related protein n=1 Tax=Streptomyces mirabilis TaxID=68239 RepID=UPI003697E8C8